MLTLTLARTANPNPKPNHNPSPNPNPDQVRSRTSPRRTSRVRSPTAPSSPCSTPWWPSSSGRRAHPNPNPNPNPNQASFDAARGEYQPNDELRALYPQQVQGCWMVDAVKPDRGAAEAQEGQ